VNLGKWVCVLWKVDIFFLSIWDILPAMPTAPPVNLVLSSGSSRFSSNKLPKGRALRGEHIVYDMDVRRSGEAQPQLEVSPITVYTSDPVLLMGRQT